jgi:hypothetical protein
MTEITTYKPTPSVGVGAPTWIYLNMFGRIVNDAFGDWPYLVGSAAMGKAWRDVDVRLILADDEYEAVIGKIDTVEMLNPRWRALCMAFSALGQHMTGLPIDFQIQQRTRANELYDGVRQALILTADFDEGGK